MHVYTQEFNENSFNWKHFGKKKSKWAQIIYLFPQTCVGLRQGPNSIALIRPSKDPLMVLMGQITNLS